jgi:RNase P subunit RPR2
MEEKGFAPNWGTVFSEIQQEMTAWRRAHPKATLREIELATEECLAALHARIVQDIAAASEVAEFAGLPEEDRPTCPSCRAPLVAHGKKQRTLRSHGDQAIVLGRAQGTCPKCGRAFFPSG